MEPSEEPPKHKIHNCPRCGGPLLRGHRRWYERGINVIRPIKHYTCPDPVCGWQGALFSKQLSRRRRRRTRRFLYGIFVTVVFLLVFVLAGFLVVRVVGFVLR